MIEMLAHHLSFNDVETFVMLALAATLGGLVRGFTGFGFAMVFVPIASIAIGPVGAVALIWFIDAPFAFPLAAQSLKDSEWSEVFPLLLGATAAFPIGVWLLTNMDPALVRSVVACVILAAAIILAAGWRYAGRAGLPLSLGVGGISGLFSGLAQLGGMPLAIFWLGAARNNAAQTKHNLNAYFALSTFVSGAVLWWSGILTLTRLWQALPLMLPYGLALLLGVRCFHLASEATFRRAAYSIIILAALSALPLTRWIKTLL